MTEHEQDTLLCCTHCIIYCFTVHSLERCFGACLLLSLSFHPFIGVCTDIRGLTREALNIRRNQVGVFFLWEALKSEVVGSTAWAITPRLHCSKRLKEICNRRHDDSRSSTTISLTTRWSIKWTETKFSFRSPTVKRLAGGRIFCQIIIQDCSSLLLSPKLTLLATLEGGKKEEKKRLLKDGLLKKTWTIVKKLPLSPPP